MFPDGWKHSAKAPDIIMAQFFFAMLMRFPRLKVSREFPGSLSTVLQGMLVNTSRDLHTLMTPFV